MCIQDGKCPFTRTIETLMKGLPDYKPVTLENKGVNWQKRPIFVEIGI
jgi:hypothetical protein